MFNMQKPLAVTQNFVQQDAWATLKQFTNARIAVGRTGHAIPLAENLLFRADHARARDSVYTALDEDRLAEALNAITPHSNILHIKSNASTRQEYLQRPDRGRQLCDASKQLVKETAGQNSYDIAIIVADGLSAHAVQLHAPGVLAEFVQLLNNNSFSMAPLCIVQQARVAISDEIGALLNSKLSIILIGERPGLSSPHSMGIYLTYNPMVGNTDESRNCISNIHPLGGLSYHEAAAQAFSLVKNAFALQLSGVYLKSHKVLGV